MVRGKRRRSRQLLLAALTAAFLLTPAWAQTTVEELRAEVGTNPGSITAWVALGNAEYAAGDLAAARESYLEAIALDYSSADAHYGLGVAQFARGDFQAALFEFTEVTRLDAERFDGHFNRGVTLSRLRRPSEAADAFRAALAAAEPEADQDDIKNAQLNLAGQLELLEQWSGAADAYGSALEIEPGNPDYILKRAAALLKAGQGLDALPELTALEAERPDYRASSLIADVYVEQGQIDYAIWSLERGLQKAEAAGDNEAQTNILVKLGNLQRSIGRSVDSTSSFERAVESDPLSWEAQYNLGVSYLERGQTRAALEPLARARRLGGERGELYLALATANDLIGEAEGAFTNAVAASELLTDPDLVYEAEFIAGKAAYRLGDSEGAFERLEALVEAHPSDAQAQLWVGLAAYQLADYPTAVRHFERATQLSPGSLEARVNLGASYLAAKRYSEAEAIYEMLVEQNPTDADSLHNLGWARLSQRDRAGALEAWTSACERSYEPSCAAIDAYL